MDFLVSYFFHFALLYISCTVIFLFYKRRSSDVKLPPGKTGLPIIGEMPDYVMAGRRGTPMKFFSDRMKKYSPDLFKTSLLGQNVAVFCGPSANKFLFSTANKYITSWWPHTVKEVLQIPEEEFDENWKKEIGTLRKFLPEFLKPDALQRYIPVMDSMAKENLETYWSSHKQVTAVPLIKKYTFGLACRLFMSITDPDHVAKLATHFNLATDGLKAAPIKLPGTKYSRAIQGGKMIREDLVEIIKERKKVFKSSEIEHQPGMVDLLTRMLIESEESGMLAMNDKEIATKVIGLLVGSHHTTSVSIASTMYYLAQHPQVYEKVFKEQMEIAQSKAPGELLNWSDVQKMKYSWCVVSEALRLKAPSQGTYREVVEDFSYGGFTIPKGWKVYWSVHSTNTNPKYFPEPEKFDPSRFEGTGPAPYTFVPFGGGPKMCPGKEYARLKILVFLHNLVTKFKWERAKPDEKIVYATFVDGLPLQLQAHENEAA